MNGKIKSIGSIGSNNSMLTPEYYESLIQAKKKILFNFLNTRASEASQFTPVRIEPLPSQNFGGNPTTTPL